MSTKTINWSVNTPYDEEIEYRAAESFDYNSITVVNLKVDISDDWTGEVMIELSNGDIIEYSVYEKFDFIGFGYEMELSVNGEEMDVDLNEITDECNVGDNTITSPLLHWYCENYVESK